MLSIGGYGTCILLDVGWLRMFKLIRGHLLFFRRASHVHVLGHTFQAEKMANVNFTGENTAGEQR